MYQSQNPFQVPQAAVPSSGYLAPTLSGVQLHVDRDVPFLVECAVRRGEGLLAENGALCVQTGARTGRSPKDRYIVDRPEVTQHVDWGAINQPIGVDAFEKLWDRAIRHVSQQGELFVSHLRVGADPEHSLTLEVITERAWHALFARQLFVREVDSSDEMPLGHWTILNAATLVTDPERDGTASDGTVILDLEKRRVLLCGMQYGGEMKKAMFTAMNYLLPETDILPMHCSANVGETGDVALFFGLSGTGKTTLSADPARFLVGDDEHGWDNQGIFNFEGGCYAKCINLTPEREPIIWNAIRFGSVIENVVLEDKRRRPDYDDDSITQNTRVAYPRDFIEKRVPGNRATHPKAILFLTCDLYGIFPPVAELSKEQAAYYFLAGYTALVGSTEVGSTEAIKSTFSTCFGAPFFPRKPREYADLLMKKLERHGAKVYLVNTGWTGGPYGGGGQRFSIASTRALIHAILRGEVANAETDAIPELNLRIPRFVHGINPRVLNPRDTWHDKSDYDRRKRELIQRFDHNMERLNATRRIREAGPRLT